MATKPSYLLPPSRSRSWFYCLTNGAACFLRVQFLTPLRRSPYLVLLGARPTVLGHNLEKYESSGKLSGRPPKVKIKTLLIAYRQLPFLKSKITKISTSSEILKSLKIENFNKNFKFPQIWNIRILRPTQLFTTIRRISENPFFCEEKPKRTQQQIYCI